MSNSRGGAAPLGKRTRFSAAEKNDRVEGLFMYVPAAEFSPYSWPYVCPQE
jgi:hypothetical protein